MKEAARKLATASFDLIIAQHPTAQDWSAYHDLSN
jgi:hypothetical protein